MTNPYRKRVVIQPHPYQYNVGLMGESGIGKTSTMVEMLEELVGYEGYIIANCGREDGVSAIAGAEYVDIPDFTSFQKFNNHVVKNKNTDWAELKVVVLDTVDELYKIIEKEVVRLHNKDATQDKQVRSVNGAFGGYGAGQNKVLEILFEELDKLASVGVRYWWVAHTKRKSTTDMQTGEEYEKLTAKLNDKYFDEFKTKTHFMGVASVDREIEVEKKKGKMGVETTKGVVLEESRRITFRDDNYNIESKSRFKDIVKNIDLSSEAFISAMYDAIEKEKAKEKDRNKKKTPKKTTAKTKEVVEKPSIDLETINEEENFKLVTEITPLFKVATEAIQDEAKEILKKYGFDGFEKWKEMPTAVIQQVCDFLK